jgi:hypothetical protein
MKFLSQRNAKCRLSISDLGFSQSPNIASFGLPIQKNAARLSASK